MSDPSSSEEKSSSAEDLDEAAISSIGEIFEILATAPIAIALMITEEVPKLLEKSRSRVTEDIYQAKYVGRFAVRHGRSELVRWFGMGVDSLVNEEDPDPKHQEVPDKPAKSTKESHVGESQPQTSSKTKDSRLRDLAIHSYDSLSASQVVKRLAGLSKDELKVIRAYEHEARGRRAILENADQLLRLHSRRNRGAIDK